MVDLRSDTVTKPTPEMRRAMAEAEVGDDVFGEDPTVNRLEALAAERLGKEAGLFVVSGTMGNQVSLMAQTQRGDEVILDESSHIFNYEVAALVVLSAVQPRTLRGQHGILDPEDIRRAIRPPNIHAPRNTLIAVESSHNRGGGTCYPPETLREIRRIATTNGMAVHLDGARIFNASIATGAPVRELAAQADSVTFCLSKGLGAPVGSVVVGTRAFIDRARRARKMFGGGMRQAGILAAAGVVALETMVDRLQEDHENARSLAEGVRIGGRPLAEPRGPDGVAALLGGSSVHGAILPQHDAVEIPQRLRRGHPGAMVQEHALGGTLQRVAVRAAARRHGARDAHVTLGLNGDGLSFGVLRRQGTGDIHGSARQDGEVARYALGLPLRHGELRHRKRSRKTGYDHRTVAGSDACRRKQT
ncbi:MAG: threonine aldolase family protein [candidate division NC10 bacterium]|nr:threonine aldolase family protein [candidate division NC10 bacterium]